MTEKFYETLDGDLEVETLHKSGPRSVISTTQNTDTWQPEKTYRGDIFFIKTVLYSLSLSRLLCSVVYNGNVHVLYLLTW